VTVLLHALSDKIRRPSDLSAIDGLAYLGTFDMRRTPSPQ
jgi:hypothetical protein